ncbi:hypothetical protein OIU79_028113 [Salix purpurea]|uniref:Uncharacterized protein n=1 Tax=Salix purpurea TaxID=77065 RepID=A0A9Q1A2L3_SALPP|nr:hypothetical protein OIU79_028113 [Salix purpurea]
MGIFQLPNLRFLSIRFNPYLMGYLPEFQSGSQLETLLLEGTNFSGNHTLFISLDLGSNRLHGPILESIFRLPNLETLHLHDNLFRGTVNVGLLRSRSLVYFQLSGNNLSVIGNINDSVALPKFQILGLGGCNLSGEFPSFLHGQNHLEFVELGGNQIEGHIPKWFMNLGTETLWNLDLYGNFLTGFEQYVDILPWNNLRYLRLSGNKLEGALPIPPRSIINYMRLQIVDLSGNCFRGKLPLEYFRNWTAMKTIYKEHPLYMQVFSSFRLTGAPTLDGMVPPSKSTILAPELEVLHYSVRRV